jgi:hypothetical protein
MISRIAAIQAVRRACAFIPMMPQDDVFVAELTEELQLLVSSEEQLAWLVSTARKVMTKWQSIADLRGLFCTRFAPADGFVNSCSVAGFRTEDLENAFRVREVAENEQRVLAYRAEAKSVAGEPVTFELLEHSKLPGTMPGLSGLEAALANAPRKPRRSQEETEKLISEVRSKLTGNGAETAASAQKVSL